MYVIFYSSDVSDMGAYKFDVRCLHVLLVQSEYIPQISVWDIIKKKNRELNCIYIFFLVTEWLHTLPQFLFGDYLTAQALMYKKCSLTLKDIRFLERGLTCDDCWESCWISDVLFPLPLCALNYAFLNTTLHCLVNLEGRQLNHENCSQHCFKAWRKASLRS